MAVLVNKGGRHVLHSEHIVGRGSRCHLRLENPLVSSSHAELRWTGTVWEIHDLDSRNGTFINGARLERGERQVLTAGMTIAFGDLTDGFELADDGPPVAHASTSGGRRREATADLLILPDPDNPEYMVFKDQGQWFAEEHDGARRAVDNGETLLTADHTWILHLPVVEARTLRRDAVQPLLRDCNLRLIVSHDQEHISGRLIHPGGVIELPPRAHMELLLRLAEERLKDQNDPEQSPKLCMDEEGWIYLPDLLGKLGIHDGAGGRNLICQHVFQARKQLTEAHVVGAIDVVERRKTIPTDGTRRGGQIRIGVQKLQIERL